APAAKADQAPRRNIPSTRFRRSHRQSRHDFLWASQATPRLPAGSGPDLGLEPRGFLGGSGAPVLSGGAEAVGDAARSGDEGTRRPAREGAGVVRGVGVLRSDARLEQVRDMQKPMCTPYSTG